MNTDECVTCGETDCPHLVRIVYMAGAAIDDPRNVEVTRQVNGARVVEIFPNQAAARRLRDPLLVEDVHPRDGGTDA